MLLGLYNMFESIVICMDKDILKKKNAKMKQDILANISIGLKEDIISEKDITNFIKPCIPCIIKGFITIAIFLAGAFLLGGKFL